MDHTLDALFTLSSVPVSVPVYIGVSEGIEQVRFGFFNGLKIVQIFRNFVYPPIPTVPTIPIVTALDVPQPQDFVRRDPRIKQQEYHNLLLHYFHSYKRKRRSFESHLSSTRFA